MKEQKRPILRSERNGIVRLLLLLLVLLAFHGKALDVFRMRPLNVICGTWVGRRVAALDTCLCPSRHGNAR